MMMNEDWEDETTIGKYTLTMEFDGVGTDESSSCCYVTHAHGGSTLSYIEGTHEIETSDEEVGTMGNYGEFVERVSPSDVKAMLIWAYDNGY
jgi:hypothetical protein|tara:strand:+ start:237 stop:512 length:276 start_codon:yes stop_codon:yes gene_type:complete